MTTIRDLLASNTITLDTVVGGVPIFTVDGVMILGGCDLFQVVPDYSSEDEHATRIRNTTAWIAEDVYYDVGHVLDREWYATPEAALAAQRKEPND